MRYNNIPGQEKPIQPLEVLYGGGYAQDEWSVSDNLKLTLGLRFDVPVFGDTGYANADADALTFRDENGQPVQYESAKLPDANILWSPRAGFNWNVDAERKTQVRGGTGIFTGPPGVCVDLEPDWQHGRADRVLAAGPVWHVAAVLTAVQPGPQRLQAQRTSPARLPRATNWHSPTRTSSSRRCGAATSPSTGGCRGASPAPPSTSTRRTSTASTTSTPTCRRRRPASPGADNRPRYTNARIHSNIANAVVLKNQNVGDSWNLAFTGNKSFKGGFVKAAYSYGEAKNTIDAGSIAFGSWNNNQHPGDPNNPGIGYASGSAGHRFFLTGSYTKEYFGFGGTTFSAYYEARTIGNSSYVFSGDLNGDGGTSNDLIYIPRDTSEMNFQTFVQSGRTYTAAEQAAAWDALIQQDDYLKEHRGEYAQRGAVFLPLVKRLDFSASQDLFTSLKGRRHAVQFRVDFVNFGNLLNSNWGVSQRLVSNSPLVVPSTAQGGVVDALGRAQYRLRLINNEYMTKTLEQTADLNDVWRIQFMLRYTFN